MLFQKGHTTSPEIRAKISATLKSKGIRPTMPYDIRLLEHSENRFEAIRRYHSKRPKYIKICSQCSKSFRTYPSVDSDCCSNKCRGKSISKPLEWRRATWLRAVHVRLTRKRSAEGSFTQQEWLDLKQKYNYFCLSCYRQEPQIKLTMDHMKPVKRGGSNFISNIQPLCRSCNAKKGIRMINYTWIFDLQDVPSYGNQPHALAIRFGKKLGKDPSVFTMKELLA